MLRGRRHIKFTDLLVAMGLCLNSFKERDDFNEKNRVFIDGVMVNGGLNISNKRWLFVSDENEANTSDWVVGVVIVVVVIVVVTPTTGFS